MKTPEDIAREAAERLVEVDHEHGEPNNWSALILNHMLHPPNNGGSPWVSSVRAVDMAAKARNGLADAIAAAICAFAAQSPVAGSPLSDERLAKIAQIRGEPEFWDTDKDTLKDICEDQARHIDYLHAIMADDLCRDALRAEREAGRREGAMAQREACAGAAESEMSGWATASPAMRCVVEAVGRTPLVTEEQP